MLIHTIVTFTISLLCAGTIEEPLMHNYRELKIKNIQQPTGEFEIECTIISRHSADLCEIQTNECSNFMAKI